MDRESFLESIKYNEKGLVPVITQDDTTGEVLMLAWMNREAVGLTLERKQMTYFSRSRQSLWLKGETSGHFQKLVSLCVDCDGDTLLARVIQEGAACHTGEYSCFYRKLDTEKQRKLEIRYQDVRERRRIMSDQFNILDEVYNVVKDRKANPKEGSYTNYLFDKGIDKICKKVGEESAEVIIAAKNNAADEIRYEIADLIYHLTVLMVNQELTWDDILEELKERR